MPNRNAAGTDGPFATLERARDAIRRMKQSGPLPSGGVQITLCSGRHERDRGFVLSAEDSGTAQAPMTYRAADGTAVVISGARVLRHFGPVTDSGVRARLDPAVRESVVQVDLRAAGVSNFGRLTRRGFSQPVRPAHLELFVDDQPMTLARWPKRGFATIDGIPMDRAKDDGHGTRMGALDAGFYYHGDRPRRWANHNGIWLHGYWAYDWANTYEKLSSYSSVSGLIQLEPPHGIYGFIPGQRFYFLNVLEELSAPGDYVVDEDRGWLYWLPPAGSAGAVVTASVVEEPLITLNDTEHVTIRGLTLDGARGHGIVIRNGVANTVAGCVLRNLGNNGVIVDGGRQNTIVGCDLYRLGDGGINLIGGDRATLTPAGHVARNNHIHHFAHWSRCYQPAILMTGVGQRAEHNLIHDGPHTGILFWGNDHVMERNEIYRVCLETGDVGAIYTGRDYTFLGYRIRHNFIHHTGGVGMGSMAIYLDDCVGGAWIEGNIFLNTTNAVFIGGGRHNTVVNNVFVNCDPAVHLDGRGVSTAKVWHDMVYVTMKERLEAMRPHLPPYSVRHPELATLAPYYAGTDGVPPGNNLVARNVAVGGRWKNIGWGAEPYPPVFENNLLDTDPQFIDAPNQDFRLKPGSSALLLPGFEPIPTDLIGLIPDEFRTAIEKAVSRLEPIDSESGALRLRLTVRNTGAASTSGQVALSLTPPPTGHNAHNAALTYELTPGNETSTEIDIIAPPGALTIETVTDSPHLRPARLQLVVSGRIRRIEPVGLNDVSQALTHEPWREIRDAEVVIAAFRWACAGADLAIEGRVTDRTLRPADTPWKGSEVEVLGARPGQNAIGQVFLVPAAQDQPDKAFHQEGDRTAPAASIRLMTTRTPDGYTLAALIPLACLTLVPDAREILLEIAVNSAASGTPVFKYRTLFGSTSAYNNTSRYARLVVGG